jgi:hypothetical protein
MEEKGVYIPLSPASVKSRKTSPIPSSMFVTEKKDPMGKVTKCKARLVAGGHKQLKDPSRTFYSPTMSSSSKLAPSDCCIRGSTCDIAGAYLLSPILSKRICSLFPKYRSFVDGKGMITVKLLKALYGCIQNTIRDLLISRGFTQNERDSCVFNRQEETIQISLGLYRFGRLRVKSSRKESLRSMLQKCQRAIIVT